MIMQNNKLKVVELFSGIGAQNKALKNINANYEIVATCDWDINSIIAYDFMHNGKQKHNDYRNKTTEELNDLLYKLNISSNGKTPLEEKTKKNLSRNIKENLLYAIDRTKNLTDITKINASNLSSDIDIMTYSFPCQDLSNAGNWHYNSGGIERNSGNRSSLLWEVERILLGMRKKSLNLPKFLLMENVTAILSPKHKRNFDDWRNVLTNLGYENKVLVLDARDFGLPQMRKRTYMISVNLSELEEKKRNKVKEIFKNYTDSDLHEAFKHEKLLMHSVLKTDYTNKEYRKEAEEANPNNTTSRQEILKKNIRITANTYSVPTITTKQDRHPNSGTIYYNPTKENKLPFRYLTPRECMILMGFLESDYQNIIDNNFKTNKKNYFFTRDKLNKMAGNSICVNVLESIFSYIIKIHKEIYL